MLQPPSGEHASEEEESKMTVRLEFADFVDLQMRLVLLPLDEDEGAFVASYTPRESCKENAGNSEESTSGEELNGKDSCQPEKVVPGEEAKTQDALPTATTEGDDKTTDVVGMVVCGTEADESDDTHFDGCTEKVAPDEKAKTQNASPTATTEGDDKTLDVVGMVVCGIATDESDDTHFHDCTGKEFASILATIRESQQEKKPIVLLLTPNLLLQPPHDDEHAEMKEKAEEERPEDDLSTTTSGTSDECDVEEIVPKMLRTRPQEVSSILGGRLSSWGSKVRATSAILAAEAASSAASIVTAASEASERAKASRLAPHKPYNTETSDVGIQCKCSLFLQNSDGKFIPLSVGHPKVTTSSVLHVRQSALQACPPYGYECQWYRSYRQPPPDGTISETSWKGATDDGSVANGLEWISLPCATHSAYQPAATDIGHLLRCVIRISMNPDDSDGEGDDTVICSMSDVVCADMSLFNGATQALAQKKAIFSNLIGRGNAEGRLFRLNIEIARFTNEETKSTDVASALTIFQISGNTAEPLHDEPVFRATAVSDPARPKDFDLIIPPGATSMVSLLSNDGHFQLQAPNRITRESLLLALGIANYSGKPADLSVRTILYPGLPTIDTTETLGDLGVTPVKGPLGEDVEFYTPQEHSYHVGGTEGTDISPNDRTKELEQELQRVVSKLARKDKVISDLQRKLVQADTKVQRTETSLSSIKIEMELKRKELQECRSLLRLVERRIETHDDSLRRLKGDHAVQSESFENRIKSQSERIVELEKNVRSLQNEKAVLSAAVEARDSKLSKMAELQTAVENLSEKVSKGDSVKLQLNDMSQRYIEISKDLEKVSKFEKECRDELHQTRTAMEDLQKRLTGEQEKCVASQSQVETLQVKTQKLQAERNNYKQKADSLSKEVSRLCRNGRTLRDIEKIVLDEESRQMEVSLLKSQKRQALEDLHHFRTAYERTVMAQHKAGLDGEAMRALEQKAELERVISEMTEYVNAKEMQLETLKQVNQALSEELHMLAQASMSKNDV